MRSGLVQLGAWAAATGAAVALSWFGVHAVLADTVFEQPTAVPLPSAHTTAVSESPAERLAQGATATTQAAAPISSAAPTPSRPTAPATPTTRRPSPSSSVHSYTLPGGRVALNLPADHAELVSATPDTGWQMQIWHGDQWMRIDFSKDGRTSSVFVTWNGHPPNVQTVPG